MDHDDKTARRIEFPLETLVASSSHRINNLLHRINSGEFLVDSGLGKQDLERVSQGWTIVRKAQARISMALGNLLFASEPFNPFLTTVRLESIVDSALDSVTDAFGENSISVVSDLPDEVFVVDSHYLAMALQNCATVALTCCSAGESKECSAVIDVQKCSNDAVEIRCSCAEASGDEIAKIQVLLEQGVDTEKAERGLLELLVAKLIVEAHGGTLSVKTENENQLSINIQLPGILKKEESE